MNTKTAEFSFLTRLRRKKSVTASSLMLCLILFGGCSGDPEIYPVSGKVTLGGKPYERLLVYMRPKDDVATKFSMGVGETDEDGVLVLRSTAGDGLQAGTYRVSFSCMVQVGRESVPLAGDQKNDDDRRLVTTDLVPAPYSSDLESPVEFTVEPVSLNQFLFDIPAQ